LQNIQHGGHEDSVDRIVYDKRALVVAA